MLIGQKFYLLAFSFDLPGFVAGQILALSPSQLVGTFKRQPIGAEQKTCQATAR